MFKITTGWMMGIILLTSLAYGYLLLGGFDSQSAGRSLGEVLFWLSVLGSICAVATVLLGKPHECGRNGMLRVTALCVGTAFIALIMMADELSVQDGLPIFLAGAVVTTLVMSWIIPKVDTPMTTDGLFMAAMALILSVGVFVFRIGFDVLWSLHWTVSLLSITAALLLMLGGVSLVQSRVKQYLVRELVID